MMDEPVRQASPPRSNYGDNMSISQIDQSMEEPFGTAAFAGQSRFPDIPQSGGGDASALAQVDGKEFFKRARHRLSFQQFNEFLANIKRLNSHVQNREDTLEKARDIFGKENQDLHVAFTALLSRHGV